MPLIPELLDFILVVNFQIKLKASEPLIALTPHPRNNKALTLYSFQAKMSTIAALTNAIKTMEASIAELRSALAEATSAEAMPQAMPQAEPEPKAKRAPSAWITFVGKTLQDMRENGWESWVDAEGILWHASTSNGEGHVYSAGPRSGKQASYPDALKLASFRNIQNKSQEERPAAAAAAKAYIEKREQFKAARDAKKAAKTSSAEKSDASTVTPITEPASSAEESDASTVTPITEPASSMKKLCCSCKHELPLAVFLKERKHMMGGNEVRVLKCCKICREKQKVRTAEGGHNERHNAAAKAQRHALKAAVAAGEPEAIAILAAAREMRDKKNAELLAAMQSGSESEATLAGGGGVELKKKRKPLTEEQKAAAKAKRDAKKAATTLNLPGEWAELE